MYVCRIQSADFSVALLTKIRPFGASGANGTNSDAVVAPADDCLDAQKSKCEATKAFSVIGPISIFLALYGFAKGEKCCHKSIAKSASVGFAFLGALSFLIVFSIAAANYNGAIDDTSSCGLDLETSGFGYGPSFYLTVVSFVLSTIAVGQISCTSTANTGGGAQGGAQGAMQGGALRPMQF